MPWTEQMTEDYLVTYFFLKRNYVPYFRDIYKKEIEGIQKFDEVNYYLSVSSWIDNGGPSTETYKDYISRRYIRDLA